MTTRLLTRLRRFCTDWTSYALWGMTLAFANGCLALSRDHGLTNGPHWAGALLGLGLLGTAAKLLAPEPPSPWNERLSTAWLMLMLALVFAAGHAAGLL